MSEEPDSKSADRNEENEREARMNRKFSMSEVIGRIAGGDFMKGGTPVSRQRQSELEIEEYLRRYLIDSGGALRSLLLRHLQNGLLDNDQQPLAALAAYISDLLMSEHLLEGLVREADAEWGRLLEERPYFQEPGRPPHPDDPYTIDSVRLSLCQLRETLVPHKP